MKKLIILALVSLPIFCTNVAGQGFLGKLVGAVADAVVNNKNKSSRSTATTNTKNNTNTKNFASSTRDAQASSTNTNNEDDVTLVVSGDGKSKEEATKVALRSAIEQVYGCFVSSDFKLLNDNVTKEEIVTISSGNIKSYEELSYNNFGSKVSITIKATISRSKLISYAKSKGASVELAGATFAANMKLKELNRKNELDALKHLAQVVIVYLPFCYDLKTTIGDIKVSEHLYDSSEKWKKLGATYDVPIKVTFVPNTNAQVLFETFWKTLNGICLSREEAKEYKKLNMNVCHKSFSYIDNSRKYLLFDFRNDEKVINNLIVLLKKAAVCELFNFEITDNLEQKIYFSPYFDLSNNNLDYNVTSTGNAIIDPWDYYNDKGIQWRSGQEARKLYMSNLWVALGGSEIDFYKEMEVDVVLKIPQADISKYSKFDVQRKSGNLVDLIVKSPNKKVEW